MWTLWVCDADSLAACFRNVCQRWLSSCALTSFLLKRSFLTQAKTLSSVGIGFFNFQVQTSDAIIHENFEKSKFTPTGFDLGHNDSVFCHFLRVRYGSVSKNFCHACTAAREPYQTLNGVGRCSTPSSVTLSAPWSRQASSGTTPSPHTGPFFSVRKVLL